MMRFLLPLAALLIGLIAPTVARADPADINAAARGVVRVVIIGTDGEEVFPVSHGSGFAISPTRIVTNAHVVRGALQDDTLRIGVVPSEGNDSAYARIISVSPRNDLALVEITGGLRLPPLTISGDGNRDSGEVSAVGYPMNVDRAQGLDIDDIFNSQPPVKSRGFLSGARPSRQFDTILHTAPIARGNSGGPLLDACGRVLGVNSFGADSGGSDAEFFFAVSTRELLPFLRANNVDARISALPCRSLADLDEAEQERIEQEQAATRADLAARAEERRAKRERVQLEAEQAVQEERENAMALAALALLCGLGLIGLAVWLHKRSKDTADWAETHEDHSLTEDAPDESAEAQVSAERYRIFAILSAIAGVFLLVAALALWFTRPGLDAIDRRVNAAMAEDEDNQADGSGGISGGTLTCTLEVERSRITGAPDEAMEFEWDEDGCVNDRTQYGYSGGEWSRIFVPNQEDAVSINSYDPDSRTFRTERFLLSRNAMAGARAERGKYTPPSCGSDDAASKLGDLQGAVTALLPDRPNERLVYSCEVKNE